MSVYVLLLSGYISGYNRVGNDSMPDYSGYWSDGRYTEIEVGVWAPNEPAINSGSCVYVGPPWDDIDLYNIWYMRSCEHALPSVCERTPCPAG